MGYIPQHALHNLNKYKYQGVDKSILSNYVLNPYWNWLVKQWPTSVAPNTITLSGFALVVFNFLTMLYYDPGYLTQKGGATGPPQWVYFTWAAGLFLYQSFDAIDGKQARRTGMAGPLGEMFDHGCDAMNTTLEVILASQALNLGRSWWTVASQIATLANFYLTTWEEYHTGQLYLGVFSGPIEGILIIVAIFVVTGFYGPSFWDRGILSVVGLDKVEWIRSNVPNVGLNVAFMLFGAAGLAFNIVTSYSNVYKSRRQSGKSPFTPLLYLLPFPATVLLQIFWLSHPSVGDSAIIYSESLVPFLCAWGLMFAHQVGRIILAHVTKSEFPLLDSTWVWSLIGAVDVNLPRILGRPPIIQTTPKRLHLFVLATLVISFVSYLRFVTLVINDITEYLGIACFTVRKKDAGGHWTTATKAKNEVDLVGKAENGKIH